MEPPHPSMVYEVLQGLLIWWVWNVCRRTVEEYNHAWGQISAVQNLIVCTWNLKANQDGRCSTVIIFDLFEGEKEPRVELNLRQFTNRNNGATQSFIVFHRSHENCSKPFQTFILVDKECNQCFRMSIIPGNFVNIKSSHGIKSHGKEKSKQKTLLHYGHAPVEKMRSFLEDWGEHHKNLMNFYDGYKSKWDGCASSGLPLPCRKVSLNYVKDEFNGSIQADYVMVYIYEQKYEVLKIVDMDTKYAECTIAKSRSVEQMKTMMEGVWLYNTNHNKSFLLIPSSAS